MPIVFEILVKVMVRRGVRLLNEEELRGRQVAKGDRDQAGTGVLWQGRVLKGL